MRSYAQIIEGLVEVLKDQTDGHNDDGAEAYPEEEEGEEEELDEEDEEGGLALGEDEEEPVVEATIWSTSSLALAPGTKFEVPLNVSEPSKCSFSFSIVSGPGPIGFALKSAEGTTLVEMNESSSEGALGKEVVGLLRAVLDNSASTFMTATVKCRVSGVCPSPMSSMPPSHPS